MNTQREPTAFLVDDEEAVRDSLSLVLEQAGIPCLAYPSAEAFLAESLEERPGCAIIDLRMPGMDGLQLQEAMEQRGIGLPVIFLTGYGDIPTSVKAIKAGALDFLTKPVSTATLLAAIEAGFAEDARLRAQAERSHSAQGRLAQLTARERDVMELAIEGLSNKEIARKLSISHRTVEIHKARVMKKAGAGNVLDLARIVREAQSPTPATGD